MSHDGENKIQTREAREGKKSTRHQSPKWIRWAHKVVKRFIHVCSDGAHVLPRALLSSQACSVFFLIHHEARRVTTTVRRTNERETQRRKKYQKWRLNERDSEIFSWLVRGFEPIFHTQRCLSSPRFFHFMLVAQAQHFFFPLLLFSPSHSGARVGGNINATCVAYTYEACACSLCIMLCCCFFSPLREMFHVSCGLCTAFLKAEKRKTPGRGVSSCFMQSLRFSLFFPVQSESLGTI